MYVVREPQDAFVSFYHFLPAYCHVDGLISIKAFAEAILGGISHSATFWPHCVGWIEAAIAHPDRVLVVTYEDLLADHGREVDRMSRFVLPDLAEDDRAALVAHVEALSTFEYMSAHSSQFDDHFNFEKCKRRMGLPDHVVCRMTKVRAGGIGSRRELPETLKQEFEARWQREVTPRLRCQTYADLRHLVKRLQVKAHPSPRDTAPVVDELPTRRLMLDAANWAIKRALQPCTRSLGGSKAVPSAAAAVSTVADAITLEGIGPEAAMKLWYELGTSCRSNGHPMNLAYVGCAPTPAAIACEWMVTAACQNAPVRVAAPGLAKAGVRQISSPRPEHGSRRWTPSAPLWPG